MKTKTYKERRDIEIIEELENPGNVDFILHANSNNGVVLVEVETKFNGDAP